MRIKTTPLVLGTAFAVVSLTSSAAVRGNPFVAETLDSGYQLAQADTKAKDGKCGEAKCGADKAKKGMNKDKKADGSCGGDKKKDGGCGADKK